MAIPLPKLRSRPQRRRGNGGRRFWGWLLFALVASVILPRLWTSFAGRGQRVPTLSELPPATGRTVGIVFGAGLWGGKPSPILGDRIQQAVELYRQHKVDKLLLTGDNRSVTHNETDAMRAAAIKLGVPARDVVVDEAGQRTYDSCYRARHIFGIDQGVLVTQDFHLDRALFLCNGLGVASTGVPISTSRFGAVERAKWYTREFPATLVALVDFVRRRPATVMGATVDQPSG